MKKKFIASITLLTTLASSHTFAEVVLKGNTRTWISASVTHPDLLIVTDDKGSWFDQGLELQQMGDRDAPYQVEARIRVLSSSGEFQVRLDDPVRIQHTKNPMLAFRNPTVTLGNEGGVNKRLMIEQSTVFHNPASTGQGEDSLGYYNFSVSAYPPEGALTGTIGVYTGVLSLTFEPVVKVP
ncbi:MULTISPECIES: hypothetical protein [Pseudomonas]|uniref:hypothetical protein n=1 Tax=Pseudomonas TaxID=286 RepID=UPI001C0A83D5|nr:MULTISPECIES: hypothetical protein [Pseudomonas]MCK3838814.1 hypothetical protein [Pseudomonas sp. NCIMB 10586]VCU67921.1 hypothetical protein [Pseudomonas synxantha]